MKTTTHPKRFLRTLSVLIGLCAASGSVNASCGDYVHTKHSRAAKPLATSNVQISPSLKQTPVSDSGLPCASRECRGDRPAEPFTVAVIVLLKLLPGDCTNLAGLIGNGDPDSRLSPSRHSDRSNGHPMRIDRPPQ